MGKLFLRIFRMAVLFYFLMYALPVQAQTPTPPTLRDTLIQAIQMRAQHDAEQGLQPRTPTDLDVLFGKDADIITMSMNEVAEIYDAQYQITLGARSPLDKLKDLLPLNVGWVVGTIAAVLLILQGVIKEYLTNFFRRMAEAFYQKLAGFKPFWVVSLRRYRKALQSKHQELIIPFRRDRPLKMQDVYVPLRVTGSTDRKIVDAYQELQKHKWLIVVGVPGAGKTMLLRHLALTYAQRGLNDFPQQPIPVLLELNRLNNSDMPLVDHLVQSLEHNDFPGGADFIQAFLKHGQILLLLDGLDEVNNQIRGRVVAQIKDLLRKYNNTRIVITCRTQVYRAEFVEQADRRLEIVDFNDQQMQRFLSAWKSDMPKGKSIEHFLSILRERPQIMTLARNPLLLTMIAYLYADTAFILPHSRVEFYNQATAFLLDHWKVESNRYRAIHKRMVLQAIALFNQGSRAGSDRTSIELRIALTQLRNVLPGLSLKDEDAQPILDEIVERSGLLITIDGGARYQFSHLSLQEFFAAEALKSEPNKLLNFFITDSDAWREVVRLWCGLEHDSTEFIKEVCKHNGILAFECLADARKVEQAYADELIRLFKSHIEDALKNDGLARALALVAADPRPRGSALFDFLESSLKNHKNQLAAAMILSITNLPKAAQILASQASNVVELRPYLNLMGDLAVPSLAALSNKERSWALDALRDIGTPLAAVAITLRLWDKDETLPYHAAWRLAMLLHQPNIEVSLRSIKLTSKQQKDQQFDWIWEPFEEPTGSALPVIAGRCAYLLLNAPNNTIPQNKPSPTTFDPRLIIPLTISKEGENKISRISYLLSGINSNMQYKLSNNSKKEIKPTLDDWRNIFQPTNYAFKTSWQALSVKFLLILICLINIGMAGKQILSGSQFWNWWNTLVGLWGLVMSLGVLLLVRAEVDRYQAKAWLYLVILGLEAVIGKLSNNSTLGYIIVAVTILGVAYVTHWKIMQNGLVMSIIGVIVGAIIGAIAGAFVSGVLWNIVRYALVTGLVTALIGVIIGLFIGIFRAQYKLLGSGCLGAIIGIVVGIVIGFVVVTPGTTIGRTIDYGIVIGGSITAFLGATGALFGKRDNAHDEAVIHPLFALLALSAYFPTKLLITTWNWLGTVLFWLIWIGCFAFLLWYSNHQTRRASNPLHGLLDKPG